MNTNSLVRFCSLLAAVVLLALGLRVTAIDWGVPTPELQCGSFHPDEPQAMTALGQMNIAKGDLEPEGAVIEGTFTHYLWLIEAHVLRAFGVITALPHSFGKFDKNYSTMLVAGRMLTVFFDVAAIILLAIVVFRITASSIAAMCSALMLAVAPFEVISAHFMRPHIIVNCMLVIMMMLSFRMYVTRHLWRHIVAAGMLAGLAAAARYPSGIMVVLPVAVLVFRAQVLRRHGACDNADLRIPLLPALGLMAGMCVVGFFIGDPYFFLNFSHAREGLAYQALFVPKSTTTLAGILDSERMWAYVSYLLPAGTKPFLWAVWYAAVAFLAFIPRHYRYTIPLCVLAILYGYPMIKGYADPMFVRPMLFLFPIFAFAVGLAVQELGDRAPRVVSALAVIIVAIAAAASVAYSIAYLDGMRRDPRVAVHRYLESDARSQLSIGYYSLGWPDWYIFDPLVKNLANKQATVFVPPFATGSFPDYIILAYVDDFPNTMCGFGWTTDHSAALLAGGRYFVEKEFVIRRTFLGFDFTDTHPPADLAYPFPQYYLLRRTDRE